ncbi:MAG TPA: Ig-like domain-containing protein [Gemmatimonadales bacterium]|nr:Ig-like domain-containing protein [Gemmatimonadales bacterium]
MKSRWTLAGLAALVVLTSCGKGGEGIADVLLVASVEVSPASGSLVLGGTAQLTATPKTASGLVVPGRAVAWTSSNPALVSVAPTGVITANSLGGPVRITATVDGVSGEALIIVQPFPIARIEITPPQAAVLVGSSTELVATAYDAQGQPLQDRIPVWTSSAPSIAAVTSTGIVLGMAEGGPVTITATAEGKSGTALITVAPRPATRLGFVQQPGNATAGQPLAPAVQVAIQNDLGGTVANGTQTVTIALGSNPGSATLSGTTTIQAINGIATFSNLALDKAGAGYTLTATATDLAPATSTSFNTGAGPPSQLTLTTAPPASATSGQPLAPQPAVQLRDAFGNAVGQAGVAVTAGIASGSATLGGSTTATTNAAGLATFATLSLTGTASAVTLAFSAAGVTPANSGPISLAPPPPSALVIVTQPSATAPSGVPFPVQPAVKLRDASGNDVQTAGVAISASLASGPAGGILNGGTVVQTTGTGTATFANLAITGPVGSYTIQFAASGLASTTSAAIAVTAAPPAALSVTTQPGTPAVNGSQLSPQPAVQLRDAAGNPVAKGGVPVTVTIASGGGTLGGTTTVNTNASGLASFSDLSITGLVGNRTLGFSSPGLSGATSAPIALTAGTATRLGIVAQPAALELSGIPIRQPVLQIEDASGNPVPMAGVLVTATIDAGPGTLSGNVAVSTNSAGTATFSNLVITGTGAYTLKFSATGFPDVMSVLFFVL